MGKLGKRLKQQRLARERSLPPIPLCTRSKDGIHRDGQKCQTCGHHHCGLCGICMRCRRYGDIRCKHVNEASVPPDPPREWDGKGPWWRVRKEKIKAKKAAAS